MQALGRTIRGTAVALAAVLVLAGCTGRAPYRADPAMPGADSPLAFDLGTIELFDEAGAMADAALENAFSRSPREALREWAATRLQTTPGQPGRLRFRMLEATAVSAPLYGTPGIKGWFTRDQAERVSVSLAARIEAVRNDGSLIAAASARADANRTFAEDIEPAERQAGLDALLDTALTAFNREIDAQIRAEMADVLH